MKETQSLSFLRYFCFGLLGALLAAIIFIISANPYRNIPLLEWQNVPLMDINQRFLYPTVARDTKYRSAVLGTSMVRTFKPLELNPAFNTSFAQLSMNSATAYEQMKIGKLFIDSRKNKNLPIDIMLFGIDDVWCLNKEEYSPFTIRTFPPWMYDDNPYNDLLYLLSAKAIEISARILRYKAGFGGYERYQRNGYGTFLPEEEKYDIEKARLKIYGKKENITTAKEVVTLPVKGGEEKNSWKGSDFITHSFLSDLLGWLPGETKKIVLFVPSHYYRSKIGISKYETDRLNACKKNILSIVGQYENTLIVDYMIPSSITKNDYNYWDNHYKEGIASLVIKELEFISGHKLQKPRSKDYQILYNSLK